MLLFDCVINIGPYRRTSAKGKVKELVQKLKFPFEKKVLKELKEIIIAFRGNVDTALQSVNIDLASSALQVVQKLQSDSNMKHGAMLGEIQSVKGQITNSFSAELDQRLPALKDSLTVSLGQRIDHSTFSTEKAISQSSATVGAHVQAVSILCKEQIDILQTQNARFDAMTNSFTEFQELFLKQSGMTLPSASGSARSFYMSTKRRRRPINFMLRQDSSLCNCSPKNSHETFYAQYWRSFYKESETFFIHDRSCPQWYTSQRNSKYRVNFILFHRLRIFGSVNLKRLPYAGISGWSIAQNLKCNPVVPRDAPSFKVIQRYFGRLCYLDPLDDDVLDHHITDCLRDLRMVFQSGRGSPHDILCDGQSILDVVVNPCSFWGETSGSPLIIGLWRLTKKFMEIGIDLNMTKLFTKKPNGCLSSLFFCTFYRLKCPPTVHSLGNGRSPSHMALDFLSWLAGQGVDISPPTGSYISPSRHELESCYALNVTVNALKKNDDFSLAMNCGDLFTAVLRRDEVTIKTVLQRWPDLLGTEQNVFGQTPIHLAVGWPSGLRILLAAADESTLHACSGSSYSNGSYCYGTALDFAIASGCIESINMLAEAGLAFHRHWIYCIGPTALESTINEILLNLFLRRLRQLHDFGLRSLPSDVVSSLQIEDFEVFDSKAEALSENLTENNIQPSLNFLVHHDESSKEYCLWPEFGGIFHQEGISSDSARAFFEAGFQNVDYEVEQLTPLMCMQFESSDDPHLSSSHFFKLAEFFIEKGARSDKEIPSCYINGFTKDGAEKRYRVIHRITSLCWTEMLQNQFSIAVTLVQLQSTTIWRGLLGASTSDPCTCACSIDGCRPINLALKSSSGEYFEMRTRRRTGGGYSKLFDSGEWNLTVNFLADLGLLLGNLEGERLAEDVIRWLCFSALGLTHTCCRHENYFSPQFGPCLITLMEVDEIDEIHEEEALLIKRLDHLVENFLKEFDELRLSLPVFLQGHWQKRMLAELSEKDEISEVVRQELDEIGIVLLEDEEEASGDDSDGDDEGQNSEDEYDEWIQSIAKSLK